MSHETADEFACHRGLFLNVFKLISLCHKAHISLMFSLLEVCKSKHVKSRACARAEEAPEALTGALIKTDSKAERGEEPCGAKRVPARRKRRRR